MRLQNQTVFMACIVAGLACPALAQQSTSTVTYQGRLTDSGQPVADGVYPMTFRLWDSATGGQMIEEIIISNVSVQGGLFTAPVPISQSTFPGEDRWWSVEFNGIGLLPRQLSTTVPYANSANTAFSGAALPGSSFDVAGTIRTTSDSVADRFRSTSTQLPALVDEGIDGTGTFIGIPDVSLYHLASARFWSGFGMAAKSGPQFVASPLIWFNANAANDAFQVIAAPVSNSVSNPLASGSWPVLSVSKYGMAVNGWESRSNPITQPGFGSPALTVNGALRITGGSDLAEPFEVAIDEFDQQPGTVVVIDPENPGGLMVSKTAYDTRVAGVISGANGLAPGMVMSKEGCEFTGLGQPIAMTGRVWVWCDADEHSIAPGDRLTTSPIPGHAMVAIDRDRADGAVIGKAMTELNEGRGLVLVLVNLQ